MRQGRHGLGGKLKPGQLNGHRLLRVVLADGGKEFLMMTPMWGPSSSDTEGKIRLTTSFNPDGMAAVEWSNALARVLPRKGSFVRCDFSAEASEQQMALVRKSRRPKNYVNFPIARCGLSSKTIPRSFRSNWPMPAN